MSDINLQENLSNLFLSSYITTSNLSTTSTTSSQSFQSYLNNYKTDSSSINTSTSFISTNTSTSSQSSTLDEKVTYKNNDKASNELEQKQTNTKTTSSKDETTEDVQEVDETTEETKEVDEITEETKKIDKITEEVQEVSEIEEDKDLKSEVDENLINILVYDPSLIYQISETLQVEPEYIVSTLSEMNLTISDLSKQENLISFMQEVLELESPEMLISIDSVKEQMYEISQISTNVSYSEVIQTTSENVTNTLEELQELELITITSDSATETEDISTLLEELSGEIIETEENTYFSTSQNLNNSSQNNNFSNQSFNSEQFNTEQNLSQLVDISDENFNFFSQSLDTTLDYSSSLSSISQKNVLQRNLNSLDIINQIMDKMKNSLKTDTSEIKLLLRPDSLGEVSLKISTQNGLIAAQFTAESQKIKEIIESNFNLLKDMLNEKGIEVSQLDVSVNDDNNSNSSSFEQFAFNQEKSETRVQNIIDKVLQEEQEVVEYVEDNELISSNVNYSA